MAASHIMQSRSIKHKTEASSSFHPFSKANFRPPSFVKGLLPIHHVLQESAAQTWSVK